MASNNDMEQLIEPREQEEARLQILLSQRRKRKLDAIIDEEASAASSSVAQHRQGVSRQGLLADIWIKATQLHGTYAQQNALEKAFVFLTMNSIINLTFDYPKLANINEQKFDDYKEKNGFANPRLCQVDGNILETIKTHATSEPPATGRFVDCSVNIFSQASKEELMYYRIYSHFLVIFEYQKESINSWRTLSEKDIFRLFSSPIFEIIFEHSVVRALLFAPCL